MVSVRRGNVVSPISDAGLPRLGISEKLAPMIPDGRIGVAESGTTTFGDVPKLPTGARNVRGAGDHRWLVEIRPLDPTIGSVDFNFMGPFHRAMNLIVALTLVAIGCGGFVYFYFIDTNWPRWITVVAAIVGGAGLYWLWEEYVNLGQRSKN